MQILQEWIVFLVHINMLSELRHKIIEETGLPISFGLSVNKVVSKVATNEAKPNNQLKIDYGLEKTFLAPLSIKKIPMVGDKTYQTLRNLGLRKVAVLYKKCQWMSCNAYLVKTER